MKEEWVIEFRNGGFFQNLEADNSGPERSAQRFASEQEANALLRKYTWMAFAGGMAKRATT